MTQTRHVGILATAGTIKSESYPLEVHKLFEDIKVSGEACPMWVPLIENNEASGEGADFFIRKYIDNLLAKDRQIDTLVLGCTHYPILLPKIQKFIPQGVKVVAQGEYVATSLKDYLHRHPEMDMSALGKVNAAFTPQRPKTNLLNQPPCSSTRTLQCNE